MRYSPERLPKVRSKLLTEAANGRPCTARVSGFYPGHRCSGEDTTIGAHLPVVGKGTATKVTDLAVCFACFNCHQIIDGVDKLRASYIEHNYPAAYAMRLLNALVETQAMLLDDGIIQVAKGEIIRA